MLVKNFTREATGSVRGVLDHAKIAIPISGCGLVVRHDLSAEGKGWCLPFEFSPKLGA